MAEKPINPNWHVLINYALVGSLLTVPTLLGMNKKAKLIYTAEALVLLPYIALTKQPVAIKGLIPMEYMGRSITSTLLNSRCKHFLNLSVKQKRN